MSLDPEIEQQIKKVVSENPVVLFMKGSPRAPQCGFSATVAGILDGLVPDYTTVDVLGSQDIREGIKAFSNWPTIPQLYIDGEFIGGCDIIKEMYAAGELQKKVHLDIGAMTAPKITITDAAAAALTEAIGQSPEGDFLHLTVEQDFQTGLQIGDADQMKLCSESNGLKVYVDVGSARRVEGMKIDYVSNDKGEGFKLDNPNQPPSVVETSPQELKQLIDSGADFRLLDCRLEKERDLANLDGSHLLDRDLAEVIEQLPKETTLVFYCHTGLRSKRAAQYFRERGFRDVRNLSGGIDAWAQEVDPQMPRYRSA